MIVKVFPGDTLMVRDMELQFDKTVTVTTNGHVLRVPQPGIKDLPETTLSIPELWPERGHRVPMEQRQDLRCPCGSAYTRQSETHLSCLHCKRVWENKDVP